MGQVGVGPHHRLLMPAVESGEPRGVLEQGDNMTRPMLWEDDYGNCGWQSQAWDREDWTPLCSGSGDKGSHPQKTAESAVFPR